MKTGRFFAAVITWVILSPISFGYSGWIEGKVGNALGFDGVNDYVEVSEYKGILGTQSRTCTAWIKTTATQEGDIVSWGTEQAGQKWMFRVESNGTLGVGLWGGYYIKTTTPLNDGQWHHVAVVLYNDGSPDITEIQLYINGVLQNTTASGTQAVNTIASQDVTLGAYKNAGVVGGYFYGMLDEVCIYNRALEASEIDPEALIPTKGLITHWVMDENIGTIAHDSISSYDGILKNMPSNYSGWVTGKSGNALALDGVNDYVTVDYNSALNSIDFTVCFWARVDGNLNTYRAAVCSRDATGGFFSGFNVFAGTSNTWEFWTGMGSSFDIVAGPVVSNGQWTHVVISFEATSGPDANGVYTGTKILYINGVQAASTPSGRYIPNTSEPFTLGRINHSGLWYFNGLLDEVCFYNRALDASEIDPEDPIPTEGLITHWTMDETEGTTAHDSISSYNGILRYIANDYIGGSGTLDDPFLIGTKDDLLKMASDTAIYDMCFILTADIDLEGQSFNRAIIAADTSYQTAGFQGTEFKGIFDGNGYKISHYTINSDYWEYCYLSLFGILGSESQIKNLRVENFTVDTDNDFAGGLVGYNSGGIIENCHATGNVSGRKYAGGLVGYLKDGSINNCSFGTYPQNSVYGTCAGGLVGYQSSGIIQNSYSSSRVINDSSLYSIKRYTGGLVGLQRNGIIKNCYSTGNAQMTDYTNDPIGGLIGEQYKGVIISSYSTTIVNSNSSYAGGLVGMGFSNQVVRSFWDTQTSGKTVSAGGIGRTTAELKQSANYIGWNGDEAVWVLDEGNDYPHLVWENTPGILLADGTLNGNLGGSGIPQEPYLINNANDLNLIGLYPSEWGKCYSLTQDIDMSEITGTNYNRIGLNSFTPFSGTFAGNGYIIRNLSYNTTVQENAVGLFGYISNATIENVGLENTNISSGGNEIGSLAGTQESGSIHNCYSINGHITSGILGIHIGGLVGYQQNGEITDCYSSGFAAGGSQSMRVGGLAGAAKGQVLNCHSDCTVYGGYYSHYLGGLVGDASGVITNCYFSGELTGNDCSNSIGGLVGNSTAIISNCYCQGNVSGNIRSIFVGGFVGRQDGGIICNCYVRNSTYGNEYIGGFAGEQASGDIVNCYTTSSIDVYDDTEIAGAFASVGLGSVVNSFWDAQASNLSESAAGKGLDTAQMKESTTYIAWNEPNQIYWTIDETTDYPRLAWENAAGISLPVQLLSDYIPAGTGTAEDPYQITTAQQLNTIGLFPNQWNKAYVIQNDIDMSEITSLEFNRIGTKKIPFTGTLDGRGHIIRNLTYKSSRIESCIGLFRTISSGAVIKNIGLENIRIASPAIYIGPLAAQQHSGTIMNCYSDGLIIGDYAVGGLIGTLDGDSVVQNSFSTTTIIGNDMSNTLGGLVGQQNNGVITDCFSTGRILGANNIGGLVGYQGDPAAIITNSYSTGIVAGRGQNIGGLLGFRGGTVSSSFWDTQTSMKSTSAGGTGKTTLEMKTLSTFTSAGWDFDPNNIDGDLPDWEIQQDYPRLAWKPDIPESIKQTGIPYNGGTGTSDDPFQIQDIIDFAQLTESPSHWNKQYVLTSDIDLSDLPFNQAFVSPSSSWYLFSGTAFSGVFDGKGHVIRNLTIERSLGIYFAGLFGKTSNAQIKNVGIENSHIASSSVYCGAIAGFAEDSFLKNSYSTGFVNGSLYIGGLVGKNLRTTISNCYSTSTISGGYYSFRGGLVGDDEFGNISNCYSTGLGAGLKGGYSSDLVSNSFWDIQTSGQTTSAGGTGKTTAEMQTKVTFSSAGWNFDGPWTTDETKNVLFLDGTDGYVEVPGYKGILGTQSRTCTAWIKTSGTQLQRIFSWGSDQAGQKWDFRVEANGTLSLSVWAGYINTTAAVNDGQWHYVVAVLDSDGSPSINEVLLYIDGVLQSTTYTSTQAIDTAASNDMVIGAFNNAGVISGYFNGMLDEVCIHDRALDAGEIDPEAPIPTEGLVARWAMDETEGTVVHDSVSSNDGILNNSGSAVWAICEGTNYPRLVWQIPAGDWACPDGVAVEDLGYFVGQWLMANCTAENNYCGGADMDLSSVVDLGDWVVFAERWLEGM